MIALGNGSAWVKCMRFQILANQIRFKRTLQISVNIIEMLRNSEIK